MSISKSYIKNRVQKKKPALDELIDGYDTDQNKNKSTFENTSINASVNNGEKETKNVSENTYSNKNINGVNHANKNVYIDESSKNEGGIDITSIAEKIADAQKTKKKQKFEDNHTKQTYWIRNDVLEAFNKIADQRGEKTKIINEALIDYIMKLAKEIN